MPTGGVPSGILQIHQKLPYSMERDKISVPDINFGVTEPTLSEKLKLNTHFFGVTGHS